MTQPTTRATFKDYCKRKLGWPVVELNLDDDQVEDCIDDGLQFFQEYHFDATEINYLKHQIDRDKLIKRLKIVKQANPSSICDSILKS